MPTLDSHPLTALLVEERTTAIAYLTRVAARHRALGFGQFGVRKEKLSRWKKSTPEIHAQLAMANLHGIDPEEIYLHPWPDRLRLALRMDADFWDLPWTVAGTVEALEDAGGLMDRPGVDRRNLVIAALGTLAATGAQWAATPPAHAAICRGPRVGPETADLFEERLKSLRSMDDILGSGHAYQAATAERQSSPAS
ncbi:hypothetical protein AB0C81_15595 [Streptomyces roseoverticillatus]|uniref:hypothetical protein n=1 Tax=Streptomyces roseoverticillatus TaxID=66429 RepID=UPI0033D26C2A